MNSDTRCMRRLVLKQGAKQEWIGAVGIGIRDGPGSSEVMAVDGLWYSTLKEA